MDLILWRHAHALGESGGPNDWQRRLSPRGEKQAQRMARWLNHQLPNSARIMSSPAVRTESTAHALGRPYKVLNDLAPEESVERLLTAVNWPQARGVTLVVGHQPTLGGVVARLLGLAQTECHIKKGALWWLRQRETGGGVQVVTVQTPDMV
jgi:phosphohistidine phosphatase